jgi:hypothetical protein
MKIGNSISKEFMTLSHFTVTMRIFIFTSSTKFDFLNKHSWCFNVPVICGMNKCSEGTLVDYF